MSASKVVLRVLSALINLLIVLVVVIGIMKISVEAYEFGYRVYTEQPVDAVGQARNVQVQISDGMSAKEIGNLLEERGLIDNAALFMVQMTFSDYKDKIKPGLYTLNTGQTADEMMAVMSSEKANEEEE